MILNISVIIPTYNEFENLLKLQNFFLNNLYKYPTIEIIVADSIKSVDNAYCLTTPYQYLKTSKTGRAAQMNAGAKIATGDILVFLHADVFPPDSFVEDIHSAIAAGYEYGFFAYTFMPTTFMLKINSSFTQKKGVFSGGGDQIHFMTRMLYDKMSGYDEKYVIMEDFDFIRRCKRAEVSYTIIKNLATVSSRKYFNNSWLKVNLVNLIAFVMFILHIDSRWIKKVYYGMLK